MAKIDASLGRLQSAFDRLERAIEDRMAEDTVWGDVSSDRPELRASHDKLENEVHALRARAAEDAKLRAEAAEAVREALSDLRGAMSRQVDGSTDGGAPANA